MNSSFISGHKLDKKRGLISGSLVTPVIGSSRLFRYKTMLNDHAHSAVITPNRRNKAYKYE